MSCAPRSRALFTPVAEPQERFIDEGIARTLQRPVGAWCGSVTVAAQVPAHFAKCRLPSATTVERCTKVAAQPSASARARVASPTALRPRPGAAVGWHMSHMASAPSASLQSRASVANAKTTASAAIRAAKSSFRPMIDQCTGSASTSRASTYTLRFVGAVISTCNLMKLLASRCSVMHPQQYRTVVAHRRTTVTKEIVTTTITQVLDALAGVTEEPAHLVKLLARSVVDGVAAGTRYTIHP